MTIFAAGFAIFWICKIIARTIYLRMKPCKAFKPIFFAVASLSVWSHAENKGLVVTYVSGLRWAEGVMQTTKRGAYWRKKSIHCLAKGAADSGGGLHL